MIQSSVADGPFPLSKHLADPSDYRTTFLRRHAISPQNTTLIFVDYSRSNFTKYRIVDETSAGNGIVKPNEFSADALFTKSKNHGLFLQLADCVGAVLYDPEHEVLGLSHLGRHNLEQSGGRKTVEFMVQHFGSDPKSIEIFLSAAAGKENYPLFDFDNRGLHEETIRQFVSAGILEANIKKDLRDTTKDKNLFSHSEFLKRNRDIDGRFAIVAMLED